MNDEEYYDVTIDSFFLGNALTAAMHMAGDIDDESYVTVEHVEIDGDQINLIVKKHKVLVN